MTKLSPWPSMQTSARRAAKQSPPSTQAARRQADARTTSTRAVSTASPTRLAVAGVGILDGRALFSIFFEGISLLKNRTPGPTDPSYKTHNGRADSCRSRYRPRQADGDGRSVCDGRHRPRQAGGDGRAACDGSCTYRLAERPPPRRGGRKTALARRVLVPPSGGHINAPRSAA